MNAAGGRRWRALVATTGLVGALVGVVAPGSQATTPGDDDVARIAAVNRMSPDKVRDILRDPAARTDANDRLLYVDSAPTTAPEAREPAAAPYPLSETFLLHSRPGATRVIHLDFDGHDVTGTWWNEVMGLPVGFRIGWDTDGSPSTFSDAERTGIQEIWQRVAEDFAPFDVDVTTQDPGPAGLNRSGTSDVRYGTKVLFTSDTTVDDFACGGGCGGVAYVDIFSRVGGAAAHPAWVFPASLYDHPAYLAEAASHEAGHNFGLNHDGSSASGYYPGHNGWAPIMGAAYDEPISQWSSGQYAGATNTEDDVAKIAGHVARVPDEAGSTVATAAASPPVGTALITSRQDVDVYRLGTCSGAVTVTGSVAAVGPNLDLKLTLLRADGTVVTSADPVSSTDRDPATGLGATISASVPSGTYYASVDGVGRGTATDGYTDYGSLGAYRMQSTGCTVPQVSPPGAPSGLTASDVTATSATLTWSLPASNGGGEITGYRLSRAGAADVLVAAHVRSWTDTGLAPETAYTWSVRALNVSGAGAAATVSATTTEAPPTTKPSRPVIGKASPGRRGGQITATARWSPPVDDGGAAVTDYRLRVLRLNAAGRVVQRLRTPWFPTSYGGRVEIALPRTGRYAFQVKARNAVGASKMSARSNVVRGR